MAQEKQQDLDSLKRRGRRRLLGAVALVLVAVIVLPMVFDNEPRQPLPPVSVRIPGVDEAPFAPKLPDKRQGEWVVPVGAFSNPQAVLDKLSAASLPYYTETKDNLTRVRAGPFPSKQAAETAAEKLKSLGFKPGTVTSKSG
jgi:DedD protein